MKLRPERAQHPIDLDANTRNPAAGQDRISLVFLEAGWITRGLPLQLPTLILGRHEHSRSSQEPAQRGCIKEFDGQLQPTTAAQQMHVSTILGTETQDRPRAELPKRQTRLRECRFHEDGGVSGGVTEGDQASGIGGIGQSRPSRRLLARRAKTLPPASGAASRSRSRRRPRAGLWIGRPAAPGLRVLRRSLRETKRQSARPQGVPDRWWCICTYGRIRLLAATPGLSKFASLVLSPKPKSLSKSDRGAPCCRDGTRASKSRPTAAELAQRRARVP
jgi:hypothetical protein